MNLTTLVGDMRNFLNMLLEDSDAWKTWEPSQNHNSIDSCWITKNCNKTECPAHNKKNIRCWLVSNTLCGFKHKCECPKCDVYIKATHKDEVVELAEHIRTLVYNMSVINEELYKKANRDPLTQLYNKNYFNEIIPRELDRVRRYKANQCLFIVDIDKFKNINDNLGHIYGDYILFEVAKILTSACRSSDYVFRYGGDEFIILSINTCCDDSAGTLSERIEEKLYNWNQYCEENIKLSISIGYTLITGELDIEDSIKAADEMMYRNKQINHRKNIFFGIYNEETSK